MSPPPSSSPLTSLPPLSSQTTNAPISSPLARTTTLPHPLPKPSTTQVSSPEQSKLASTSWAATLESNPPKPKKSRTYARAKKATDEPSALLPIHAGASGSSLAGWGTGRDETEGDQAEDKGNGRSSASSEDESRRKGKGRVSDASTIRPRKSSPTEGKKNGSKAREQSSASSSSSDNSDEEGGASPQEPFRQALLQSDGDDDGDAEDPEELDRIMAAMRAEARGIPPSTTTTPKPLPTSSYPSVSSSQIRQPASIHGDSSLTSFSSRHSSSTRHSSDPAAAAPSSDSLPAVRARQRIISDDDDEAESFPVLPSWKRASKSKINRVASSPSQSDDAGSGGESSERTRKAVKGRRPSANPDEEEVGERVGLSTSRPTTSRPSTNAINDAFSSSVNSHASSSKSSRDIRRPPNFASTLPQGLVDPDPVSSSQSDPRLVEGELSSDNIGEFGNDRPNDSSSPFRKTVEREEREQWRATIGKGKGKERERVGSGEGSDGEGSGKGKKKTSKGLSKKEQALMRSEQARMARERTGGIARVEAPARGIEAFLATYKEGKRSASPSSALSSSASRMRPSDRALSALPKPVFPHPTPSARPSSSRAVSRFPDPTAPPPLLKPKLERPASPPPAPSASDSEEEEFPDDIFAHNRAQQQKKDEEDAARLAKEKRKAEVERLKRIAAEKARGRTNTPGATGGDNSDDSDLEIVQDAQRTPNGGLASRQLDPSRKYATLHGLPLSSGQPPPEASESQLAFAGRTFNHAGKRAQPLPGGTKSKYAQQITHVGLNETLRKKMAMEAAEERRKKEEKWGKGRQLQDKSELDVDTLLAKLEKGKGREMAADVMDGEENEEEDGNFEPEEHAHEMSSDSGSDRDRPTAEDAPTEDENEDASDKENSQPSDMDEDEDKENARPQSTLRREPSSVLGPRETSPPADEPLDGSPRVADDEEEEEESLRLKKPNRNRNRLVFDDSDEEGAANASTVRPLRPLSRIGSSSSISRLILGDDVPNLSPKKLPVGGTSSGTGSGLEPAFGEEGSEGGGFGEGGFSQLFQPTQVDEAAKVSSGGTGGAFGEFSGGDGGFGEGGFSQLFEPTQVPTVTGSGSGSGASFGGGGDGDGGFGGGGFDLSEGGFSQLFDATQPAAPTAPVAAAPGAQQGLAALKRADAPFVPQMTQHNLPEVDVSRTQRERDEALLAYKHPLEREEQAVEAPEQYINKQGFLTQHKPTDSPSDASATPFRPTAGDWLTGTGTSPLVSSDTPFNGTQDVETPVVTRRLVPRGALLKGYTNSDDSPQAKHLLRASASTSSIAEPQPIASTSSLPSLNHLPPPPLPTKTMLFPPPATNASAAPKGEAKKARLKKQAFAVEEAEESEDEDAGFGGFGVTRGPDDDEEEEDQDKPVEGLVDDEKLTEDQERKADEERLKFRRQQEELDDAAAQKRLQEVVNGQLRKKRKDGTFEFDSDEEDEERFGISSKARREERRKKRKLEGLDPLDRLAVDEETQSFAQMYNESWAADEDGYEGLASDQEDEAKAQNVEEKVMSLGLPRTRTEHKLIAPVSKRRRRMVDSPEPFESLEGQDQDPRTGPAPAPAGAPFIGAHDDFMGDDDDEDLTESQHQARRTSRPQPKPVQKDDDAFALGPAYASRRSTLGGGSSSSSSSLPISNSAKRLKLAAFAQDESQNSVGASNSGRAGSGSSVTSYRKGSLGGASSSSLGGGHVRKSTSTASLSSLLGGRGSAILDRSGKWEK